MSELQGPRQGLEFPAKWSPGSGLLTTQIPAAWWLMVLSSLICCSERRQREQGEQKWRYSSSIVNVRVNAVSAFEVDII